MKAFLCVSFRGTQESLFSFLFFEHILQPEQLVAVLCRLDEIELFRCFLHQLARAVDALFQLLFRHVFYNRVGSGIKNGRFRVSFRLFLFRFRLFAVYLQQRIVARADNLFRSL